ncbi:MAG: 30S ribosomal protein S12 methylthiotransferase RimO [Lachnospiraceae bacterium]|nr:30S ribosomal protein S12 methylthiotransferase RimO [Lachnospiraceae bacterium]
MKLFLVSLGCDKNLTDSEHMMAFLIEAGHTFTDDETEAEGVIINTCCFIGDAKEESINTILEYAAMKQAGDIKLLVVTGCLAQRYCNEIRAEIPEVDILVGTTAFADIADAIKRKEDRFRPVDYLPKIDVRRSCFTGTPYAYLKIAEGCDKHCTYCAIPSMRGRYRSVPKEELLREAKDLAKAGIKELILVAQETGEYGLDLYGRKALPELLRELAKVSGIRWIRVLYMYPEEITDEIIETIATEEKVVKYLDLPIQHASDTVLKRMARKTTRKEILSLLKTLRKRIPGIVLRTSLIAGFPGETEAEHEELCDFVREAGFDRLGVFAYSREENTPAAKMSPQIPKRIRQKRRNAIMRIAAGIEFEKAKDHIGEEIEVCVDGYLPEDHVLVCRSYMDAPGVDGYVFVYSEEQLNSGTFLDVKVTGAKGYDLIARIIE